MKRLSVLVPVVLLVAFGEAFRRAPVIPGDGHASVSRAGPG